MTFIISCETNPDIYVEEGIKSMNSGQYNDAAVRFKTALKNLLDYWNS